MYVTETQVRVRYGETDRMGYVYYGVYASYFEVARVESLRQLGMSYREMEEGGILLPVMHYEVRYRKPAFYDDVLTIQTTVPELPQARIRFLYETFNDKGETVNTAETTLVFLRKDSGRPCAAPEQFLRRMESFFPR